MNKYVSGIWGFSPEDLIGKNFWEIFPKLKGSIVEKNFFSSMKTRQSEQFEIKGTYLNGYFDVKVFPSFEGISVLLRDITENKKAEESLKSSEENLRIYLESSPIAIFVADHNGNYEYVNEAASRLVAYPREELLNNGQLLKLFPKKTYQSDMSVLTR